MTDNTLPLNPKRTRGKGLKRTQKQWEETITRHLGKIIDNLKVSDMVNLIPMLGCGYLGLRAWPTIEGFITGTVLYKCATSNSEVVSAAAGIGLISIGIMGLDLGQVADYEARCPEGYNWNPITGACMKIPEQPTDTSPTPPPEQPPQPPQGPLYRVVCEKGTDKLQRTGDLAGAQYLKRYYEQEGWSCEIIQL